jgi:hypothetical protein
MRHCKLKKSCFVRLGSTQCRKSNGLRVNIDTILKEKIKIRQADGIITVQIMIQGRKKE